MDEIGHAYCFAMMPKVQNESSVRDGVHILLRRHFYARSQNCEKPFSLVMSVCLSVRPSTRMEQLGSHWTDFHEM